MNDRNKEFWEDGIDYNSYVCQELGDERKLLWRKQLLKNIGSKDIVKILDIGCGPGFFSCLLSECGYDVTGIDRSEDMLKFAEMNAEKLNVSPTFIKMDALNLSFNENTFDAIVSRNVTWTFHAPEDIYLELYKKLKTGGQLIIYDANWHLPFYDSVMMGKVKENEQWYFAHYKKPFKIYDDDESIFENLPLSNTRRPQWDLKVLKDIGFSSVEFCEDIGQSVYSDWEKKLYSATPMFEIIAIK